MFFLFTWVFSIIHGTDSSSRKTNRHENDFYPDIIFLLLDLLLSGFLILSLTKVEYFVLESAGFSSCKGFVFFWLTVIESHMVNSYERFEMQPNTCKTTNSAATALVPSSQTRPRDVQTPMLN
jgi:hypothetical protein